MFADRFASIAHAAGRPYSRRAVLQSASAGFGYLALRALAAGGAEPTGRRGESVSGEKGVAGEGGAAREHVAGATHFAPRAKRVVFLFMRGGPSQMETFHYKPRLQADHGKPSPANKNMKLLGSQWKFAQYGQSGLWVSDLMPHTARMVDELCLLHACTTDHTNHPEASDQLHTGSFQFERPSLGAWVHYGLGSENDDMPGFVSIKPPVQWGGVRYYGCAFLPPAHQGLPLGTMNEPMAKARLTNAGRPDMTAAEQRRQLELLAAANRDFAAAIGDADGRIEGVIRSYESAFRMQQELPRLLDLKQETAETLDLYGVDKPETNDFGRQCLTARRLLESGVRFVELTHDNWDHHAGVAKLMPSRTAQIDRPIAGLLADLKRRGLLDDTLVVWGGEFGRTPDDPTNDGRGHNKDGFTMWLAGGGVRRGFAHGATDEHGYKAVEGAVHIHDLHATILHLLGLDHERLTYPYGGRDFRLTDVHGRVVREILA